MFPFPLRHALFLCKRVAAIASVYGEGSRIMEEIAIIATYDFEEKKNC